MRAHLLVVLSLAACNGLSESTEGELGRAVFEIDNSYSDLGAECFIACGLDRPIMLGSNESIHVINPQGMPYVHGTSSDPAVFTIEEHPSTRCNSTTMDGDHYAECLAKGGEARYQFSYRVWTVGSGSAYLELRTEDGELYDRVPIDVHRASSLEFQIRNSEHDYESADTIRLVGQHENIRVLVRDSDDNWMFANGGVTLELPDMTVASFYGANVSTNRPYTELWPLARGSSSITAHAGGLTVTRSIVSQ
jgi:hypothetical protein